MPADKADLRDARSGYGGRTYDVRGTLRGFDGEWYRARRGKHTHRVVLVGPDGRSEDTSYRVRAKDFQESPDLPAPVPAATQELSLVGQRGAVTIAASLREKLGIREGGVVIQEERDGGVWIHPAEVVPRGVSQTSAVSLDALLAAVTPENIHGEIDTGDPVGRERL